MSQTRSRSKGAAAAAAGRAPPPGGELSPTEPEVLMSAAGPEARGKARTKKTRLLEQTTQEQELPGGDQLEIREVREVQEVVKRVAVVRPRGRRGEAASQHEADSQGEQGEEAPEQAGSAGAGVSTRTRRRMDAELLAAMQQDLGTVAAGPELRPGARRRVQKRVIVEGAEEPRQAGAAGVAPELPATEPGEPELPGGALEAALGELQEAQLAEEAAEAATAGAAERGLHPPEAGEEDEEEEGGGEALLDAGSPEEFATPSEGRVIVEATPEDLPAPMGAALRLRPTQEVAQAGVGEGRAPHAVRTPPGRKRKAPGAPPSSLPPLGLGRRAHRGRLFGHDTAPAAEDTEEAEEEEAPAEEQVEQLPTQVETEGAGPGAASAARLQQHRPARAAMTAHEEAEWEEAGAAGAEDEAGGEEEAGEAEGQASEEEEPAGRGILGAVAAVGRTLRSALGAGTHQAVESNQQKVPATPAAAPSGRHRPAKLVPAVPTAGGVKPGAAKKQPAKKARGRRRTSKEESYRRYLHRVLKQVHPDIGISAKAMAIMNDCMIDVFNRVAEEAGRLTQHGKHATLTSREVQTAVRLTLPGALGAHAAQEGRQAVLRSAG